MTLLLFLLILSILVFVHELGHFFMAKKSGILVEEFGFGLPPRIWGKKIGETVYSINALPIGGFVKLFGEDSNIEYPIPKLKNRAFYEKSVPRRITVILAGVVMNFFLAILVFSVIYLVTGIPTKTGRIKIVGMADNSPAAIAGLKIDDQVMALDGEPVGEIERFIKLTKEKAGQIISLEVKRDKDNLIVSLIPREQPPEGEGPLGVAISEAEMKRYAFWLMPFYGIREGFKESLAWGEMIFKSLMEMFKNLIIFRQIPKDVSGPIGIYQATGMVAKSGILAILQFLGILSVNLAIINILPFPALDGGRLLFLGIEAVFGKKVTPKIEAWVNNFGMALLLLLLLLITINDIVRILAANNILEKISRIAF